MATKTLNTRIVLRNDSTTNWLANETQVLLKGEVGIEFQENGKVKIKIGDGTTAWSALSYFGGGQDVVDFASEAELQAIIEGGDYSIGNIYRYRGSKQLESNNNIVRTNDLILITEIYNYPTYDLGSVIDLCTQVINVTTNTIEETVSDTNTIDKIFRDYAKAIEGDILIVKELIAGDKYSYTAYVYNNLTWKAMDGNYSAENVYFPSNLTTTKAIGYVELKDGQATIEAKGKNLVEVWNDIFVDEDTELQKTNPNASITVTAKYLEIGSSDTVTATMNLDDGEYAYGYTTEEGSDGDNATNVKNDGTTGVTAISYTLDGTTQASKSFTISSGVETDLDKIIERKGIKKIGGTVNHTAGKTPVSNLKKMYPSKAFAADTALSADEKDAFYWYVPMYHGFKYSSALIADPKNITASEVQGLGTTIKGSNAFNKTKPTTLTATGSWRQYFVAIPSDYNAELSKILDSNSLPLTVEKANNVTITFGSGDNKADVVYEVFYVNLAADYDTTKINLTW